MSDFGHPQVKVELIKIPESLMSADPVLGTDASTGYEVNE